MVLLDVVRRLDGVRLIVVHVNHGIRKDATEDAKLVQTYAMSHNLTYEQTELSLGNGASEEVSRNARYEFLRHISKKYNAQAILTAHHKDDLLETAIINLLRGTGWRGLSSLRSTGDIIRPLLQTPKSELQAYAVEHDIPWRYDSTNDNTSYLRNYVRHNVVPKTDNENLEKLYQYIVRQNELTDTIDDETAHWLETNISLADESALLPRYPFIMMPHHVAHELLQAVLRRVSGKSMTRPLADRALLFTKVAKAHKTFPINADWQLRALLGEMIVERR